MSRPFRLDEVSPMMVRAFRQQHLRMAPMDILSERMWWAHSLRRNGLLPFAAFKRNPTFAHLRRLP